MKATLISVLSIASLLSLTTPAAADDVAERTAAIRLCRAEVSQQAGSEAEVRLDQVQVRPRAVRVDLDVWRNGTLQNVRCDVARGRDGQVTIAAISPSLQTASLIQ